MLMDMNSRPAQIYGMPMGVRGFSLHGNMGLLADDANQTQLNTIVDMRRKIMALVPTLNEQSDRDWVNGLLNTTFSGKTYPLSSDVADGMISNLDYIYKSALNKPRSQKPFSPVGLPAAQTQPSWWDSITGAFASVPVESQQAQPGFFDSLAMGAKEAFSSVTSSLTPGSMAPSAAKGAAPEILPDNTPTTWILKQQPAAAVVSLPSGPPSGAVPFKPQGPNFLDTLASVFGGVAIAAPGVATAGQMFRKPPRQLPQLQQQPQPPSDWPKVAVVGLAVAAVIAVSVIAFKPKK